MSREILVVGATGNVGSAAVSELAKAGHRVRAASRSPGAAASVDGVQAVRFDYGDASTFDAALDGVDTVFLLAPPGDLRSDVLTEAFLDRATKRVRKIVTMSADGVQYADTSPLRKVELRVEQSGVAYVHLRPGWFMQNFHTYWVSTIQADGLIAVPAGSSKTAFIDARDIGATAAAVLLTDAHDGQALSLTGPEALTYEEAAAVLSRAAGRPIRYVNVSDAAFLDGLIAAGMPRDYADHLTVLFSTVRAGAASQVHETVASVLGRQPRTLAAYAADHAAQWRR
jgi:uncharacterized protein YbjT (DUF2867 family)